MHESFTTPAPTDTDPRGLRRSIKALFARTEIAFLTVAVPFGLLFVFITPPFQAPDEVNHFFRAYQVSDGRIVGVKQGEESGGVLPRNLVGTAYQVSSEVAYFPNRKVDLGLVIDLLDFPLNRHETLFSPFANTVLYSPVPYIPQAIGISMGKYFNLSPIILMYLGRMATLAVALALTFYAIALTPVFKRVFFVLALTPMAIFQTASLSADSMTHALSFLLIAMILRMALEPDLRIGRRDLIALFAVSIALGLSKQSYFLLTLLFLMIPVEKIGSAKRYGMLFAGLVLSVAVAVGLWSLATRPIYTYHWPDTVNSPTDQMRFIFSHPLEYARVFFRTYWLYWPIYVKQFLGHLGSLDTELPWLLRFLVGELLIIVALLDGRGDLRVGGWGKSIAGLTAAVNVVVMTTAAYLVWNAVGDSTVKLIQGRYFIPIAPLCFLLLYNRRLHGRLPGGRFNLLIAAATCATLTATLVATIRRYYLY